MVFRDTFKDWVLGTEAMLGRETGRWAKASMRYQVWEANLRLSSVAEYREICSRAYEVLLLGLSHPTLNPRSALEPTEPAVNREVDGIVQYRSTTGMGIPHSQ